MTPKPEGYHEHHRQKRRGGDERPVNKLYVGPELHDWIEKHPQEAMELGWTVSQYEDPVNVVVTIPDKLPVAKRKRNASTPEERKARKSTSIWTPKDEENILPELVDAAREKLAPQMGWQPDVPSYYVIVAALAAVLQS